MKHWINEDVERFIFVCTIGFAAGWFGAWALTGR